MQHSAQKQDSDLKAKHMNVTGQLFDNDKIFIQFETNFNLLKIVTGCFPLETFIGGGQ